MAHVYRPVKPPPKLHYTILSSEAQKTLEDLQRKYSNLLTYVQTPNVSRHDPTSYYKSIYNASFRKCFNTTFSERDQDGNSNIPDCKHICEKLHSPENKDKLNTKSAIEYAHNIPRSIRFEKKDRNIRPETEVFLKYRPSDEEIEESILQLTQRTSRPDSPCLDLNCDLEENKQFEGYTSEQSVSRGPNITDNFHTAYSPPSTFTNSRSESYCQQVNYLKGNYKELCKQAAGKESPKTTRIIEQKKYGITDVTCEVSMDHSPVIFSSVDETHDMCTINADTSESKHKHFAKANNTHHHKENKDTLKAMEVADFELNLSDCEFSQSYSSQHNSKDSFQNSTDAIIKQDLLLKDSSEQCESPFEKDKMATKRCDAADIPLQTFIGNLSSENDEESPFVETTEASKINQMKPVVKTSLTAQGTSKIAKAYVEQKIDNLFPSAHYKKDSLHKGHIQAEKRRNEQGSNSGTKKSKPYFRPPFKENTVLNSESDTLLSENSRNQLGTSSCPSLDVVSFSSLSPEKQTQTLHMWECSQSLVLTLLYNTHQTLMTTFYSAADHAAKKKNSALQQTVVGIIILDECSSTSSFLIPSEFICRNDIKASLLSILASENITKIIANCKEFLIGVHKLCSLNSEHGIPCENIEDPVIACWLVDPDNQPASFMQMCRTADVEHRDGVAEWPAYLQLTPKLMHNFRNKLKANRLWSVYTQIEMKLIPVLACMETQTIKVDKTLFVKFSDILKLERFMEDEIEDDNARRFLSGFCHYMEGSQYTSGYILNKIKKLEEAVYKEAGRKFSLNSHVQLRQILYEELQLDKKLAPDIKIIKTDVSNQKSTCESSLKLLADVHPLPALILEYRQMQKLMSTYVDGMMSCVTNGSIMTHWDQTAAATGRLTSSQPNIQAVPKTVITVTDFQPNYVIGSEMSSVDIHAREPFISRPGYVFLAADFQQTELRVLAHLSGDSTLQSLFKNTTGEDVFISLTKQWQNKASKEVTSADREQTKRVVYSVMYGVGKDKLSEYLKVKPDIAQDIITSFLLQFPAIGSFTKKCWTYALEFGYTETVSGRRRYFPHINSNSLVLRAQAQRQAVNFCVQGSAADICKLAMLAVEGQLQEKSHLSCRLLLQIHDELIWEVPEDQLLETKSVVQKVIEDPETLCGTLFSLQIPLTVAFSSGKSWAHMNPIM